MSDNNNNTEKKTDPLFGRVVKRLLELNPTPPDWDEGDKHYVLVQLQVNRVDRLSTSDGTVFVDFAATYWWRDKALVGKKGSDFDLEALWKPDIEWGLMDEIEEVIQEGNYYINEEFEEHGIVGHWQRYKCVVAVPMELHNFPFDEHTIKLTLNSSSMSEEWVEFVDFSTKESLKEFSSNIKLTEWRVTSPMRVVAGKEYNSAELRDFATLTLEIPVRRQSSFYLYKVVPLVFVIGIMVCGVPVVDAASLSDRFQITLTLLLSQIAFAFVIGESLPKISYATKLDSYFMVNYAFLCFSCLENILVYLIQKYGSQDVAQIIDWISIGIFLVIHLYSTFKFINYSRKNRHKKLDSNVEESKLSLEL